MTDPSGQIIIFPQPGFSWNKGSSLPKRYLWGEVVWGRDLIWPDPWDGIFLPVAISHCSCGHFFTSLKLTASSHLKIGPLPAPPQKEGNSSEPTPVVQVQFVSFREGTWWLRWVPHFFMTNPGLNHLGRAGLRVDGLWQNHAESPLDKVRSGSVVALEYIYISQHLQRGAKWFLKGVTSPSLRV